MRVACCPFCGVPLATQPVEGGTLYVCTTHGQLYDGDEAAALEAQYVGEVDPDAPREQRYFVLWVDA